MIHIKLYKSMWEFAVRNIIITLSIYTNQAIWNDGDLI